MGYIAKWRYQYITTEIFPKYDNTLDFWNVCGQKNDNLKRTVGTAKSDFEVGTILNVKDFNQYVWVADVNNKSEKDIDEIWYSLVSYRGDNVPNINDTNISNYALWPEKYKFGDNQQPCLPWTSGMWKYRSSITISSPELVWNWWADDYVWGDSHKCPYANTRYIKINEQAKS
jgi:hypothetical protein